MEKELDHLSKADQVKLLNRLINRLRKKNLTIKKELDWTKLYGVGRGLWKDEDAQKYVNRLREERI
ncbi:MAG: hypothetical protein KKF20_02440 [Bacteroidetes bacterium]|nr:hypothetical protein [Bacteroidota bacterium]MBU1423836.1 hypothetical protein [Bacteroidota bacterium]MBU2471249.1 hypothetical protein [Bacteroidota bacterium]